VLWTVPAIRGMMAGVFRRQLAITLVALARPLLAQCPDGTPPPCNRATTVRAAAPAPLSVAVLPFESRSPDSSDAYLADGMTDEIGNRLTQVGRLQIKPRGVVAAQWRRTPESLDAARRLNVAWFVYGSVRHAGARLLVNVQLGRVTTGEEVWGSRFVRADADMFAVQAEVAESVAVVVAGRLSPNERAAVARRPTLNNEAYRLYVYGNALVARRTAQDIRRGLAAYGEATRLDPTFAAAWARIAVARLIQPDYEVLAVPWDSVVSAARDAVRRAMALDSSSADVLLADGALATRSGDPVRARTSLERAVLIDSLNEEAVAQLANVYVLVFVDSARGEAAVRRTLALNPDRQQSWAILFLLRWYTGHLAAAGAVLDTLESLGPWAPASCVRASYRFQLGDGAGALAALAGCHVLPSRRLEDLRALYAIATGDSTSARAVLARLQAQADSGQAVHADVARFSMALGRREDALAALERAVTEPSVQGDRAGPPAGGLWQLLHDPAYAPLRGEPRFERLWEGARPRMP
jgi:TolB-like protein/Tfp pilus assembly protein PilF